MIFASDNTGPAAPEIMDAILRANEGYAMPYGNDPLTAQTVQKIRDLFEAPAASVHMVATGTAANALALATLANPWDAIFVHRIAHAENDECGAPEFYTGGSKLVLVDGPDGKMDASSLERAILSKGNNDVHAVQRGPVSITNITEIGTAYSLEEIHAITEVAKSYGLKTHLDGARFANACAALGCTPAEMTWKARIDAVSFGGTKNGCLGVEAVVFFDPAQSWELELRRKRAAHLFSKYRFLSAQMDAYVTDGLWLRLAERSNARSAQLFAGLKAIPGVSFEAEPAGNMIFARMPRALHRRALEAGAKYAIYSNGDLLTGPEEEMLLCRFVCDWSCSAEKVDAFLAVLRG